jgi:hypothetical protein
VLLCGLQGGGSAVVGLRGLDPSGAEQRKALVPVPERMWALRNVANNMLRTGSGDQAGEALNMLQEAADLAADHYGRDHPGKRDQCTATRVPRTLHSQLCQGLGIASCAKDFA